MYIAHIEYLRNEKDSLCQKEYPMMVF